MAGQFRYGENQRGVPGMRMRPPLLANPRPVRPRGLGGNRRFQGRILRVPRPERIPRSSDSLEHVDWDGNNPTHPNSHANVHGCERGLIPPGRTDLRRPSPGFPEREERREQDSNHGFSSHEDMSMRRPSREQLRMRGRGRLVPPRGLLQGRGQSQGFHPNRGPRMPGPGRDFHSRGELPEPEHDFIQHEDAEMGGPYRDFPSQRFPSPQQHDVSELDHDLSSRGELPMRQDFNEDLRVPGHRRVIPARGALNMRGPHDLHPHQVPHMRRPRYGLGSRDEQHTREPGDNFSQQEGPHLLESESEFHPLEKLQRFDAEHDFSQDEEPHIRGPEHDFALHEEPHIRGPDHEFEPQEEQHMRGPARDFALLEEQHMRGPEHDSAPHGEQHMVGSEHDFSPHEEAHMREPRRRFVPHEEQRMRGPRNDFHRHEEPHMRRQGQGLGPGEESHLNEPDHDFGQGEEPHMCGPGHGFGPHEETNMRGPRRNFRPNQRAHARGLGRGFGPSDGPHMHGPGSFGGPHMGGPEQSFGPPDGSHMHGSGSSDGPYLHEPEHEFDPDDGPDVCDIPPDEDPHEEANMAQGEDDFPIFRQPLLGRKPDFFQRATPLQHARGRISRPGGAPRVSEERHVFPPGDESGTSGDQDGFQPSEELRDEGNQDLSPGGGWRGRRDQGVFPARGLSRGRGNQEVFPPRGMSRGRGGQDVFPPRGMSRGRGDQGAFPPRGMSRGRGDQDVFAPRGMSRGRGDRDVFPPRGMSRGRGDRDVFPPRGISRGRGDRDVFPPRGMSRGRGDRGVFTPHSVWQGRGDLGVLPPGGGLGEQDGDPDAQDAGDEATMDRDGIMTVGMRRHPFMEYCQACEVGDFLTQFDWQKHVENAEHCLVLVRKYCTLTKESFAELYGNIPYSCKLDLPLESCPSDCHEKLQKLETLMNARSGLLLSFHCQACDEQTEDVAAWLDHLESDEHAEILMGSIEFLGVEQHRQRYELLPLPEVHRTNVTEKRTDGDGQLTPMSRGDQDASPGISDQSRLCAIPDGNQHQDHSSDRMHAGKEERKNVQQSRTLTEMGETADRGKESQQAASASDDQDSDEDGDLPGHASHPFKENCEACECRGFRTQARWQRHVESLDHCAMLVYKYYSLARDEYACLFGDLPYSSALDAPLEACPPDLQKRMESLEGRMMCRSGVLLAFHCGVCDIKSTNIRDWMDHIESQQHFTVLEELVEELGLAKHRRLFGHLPLPEEFRFETFRTKWKHARYIGADDSGEFVEPDLSHVPRPGVITHSDHVTRYRIRDSMHSVERNLNRLKNRSDSPATSTAEMDNVAKKPVTARPMRKVRGREQENGIQGLSMEEVVSRAMEAVPAAQPQEEPPPFPVHEPPPVWDGEQRAMAPQGMGYRPRMAHPVGPPRPLATTGPPLPDWRRPPPPFRPRGPPPPFQQNTGAGRGKEYRPRSDFMGPPVRPPIPGDRPGGDWRYGQPYPNRAPTPELSRDMQSRLTGREDVSSGYNQPFPDPNMASHYTQPSEPSSVMATFDPSIPPPNLSTPTSSSFSSNFSIPPPVPLSTTNLTVPPPPPPRDFSSAHSHAPATSANAPASNIPTSIPPPPTPYMSTSNIPTSIPPPPTPYMSTSNIPTSIPPPPTPYMSTSNVPTSIPPPPTPYMSTSNIPTSIPPPPTPYMSTSNIPTSIPPPPVPFMSTSNIPTSIPPPPTPYMSTSNIPTSIPPPTPYMSTSHVPASMQHASSNVAASNPVSSSSIPLPGASGYPSSSTAPVTSAYAPTPVPAPDYGKQPPVAECMPVPPPGDGGTVVEEQPSGGGDSSVVQEPAPEVHGEPKEVQGPSEDATTGQPAARTAQAKDEPAEEPVRIDEAMALSVEPHPFRKNCKLCGAMGFQTQPDWQRHVESVSHCSALLHKYYSLREDTFVTLYGDVPYSHTLDLPLEKTPTEFQQRLEIRGKRMICRSGIFLTFHCKACKVKLADIENWLDHVESDTHFEVLKRSVESLGVEKHRQTYEHLPLPEELRKRDGGTRQAGSRLKRDVTGVSKEAAPSSVAAVTGSSEKLKLGFKKKPRSMLQTLIDMNELEKQHMAKQKAGDVVLDKAKQGSDTAKAGSDTNKAGSDTVKVGSDTTKAGSDTAKAGSDTLKVKSDITKAGSDTNKAGSDTVKVGSDTTKAGSDTTKAGSATQKVESDPAKAGSDTNKAGSDAEKVGSDITKAGSDTVKVGSDTIKVGSDTSKAGSDTKQPESDTVKGGTDITKAESGASKAGQGQSKAGSDTAKVGSDAVNGGTDTKKAESGIENVGNDKRISCKEMGAKEKENGESSTENVRRDLSKGDGSKRPRSLSKDQTTSEACRRSLDVEPLEISACKEGVKTKTDAKARELKEGQETAEGGTQSVGRVSEENKSDLERKTTSLKDEMGKGKDHKEQIIEKKGPVEERQEDSTKTKEVIKLTQPKVEGNLGQDRGDSHKPTSSLEVKESDEIGSSKLQKTGVVLTDQEKRRIREKVDERIKNRQREREAKVKSLSDKLKLKSPEFTESSSLSSGASESDADSCDIDEKRKKSRRAKGKERKGMKTKGRPEKRAYSEGEILSDDELSESSAEVSEKLSSSSDCSGSDSPHDRYGDAERHERKRRGGDEWDEYRDDRRHYDARRSHDDRSYRDERSYYDDRSYHDERSYYDERSYDADKRYHYDDRRFYDVKGYYDGRQRDKRRSRDEWVYEYERHRREMGHHDERRHYGEKLHEKYRHHDEKRRGEGRHRSRSHGDRTRHRRDRRDEERRQSEGRSREGKEDKKRRRDRSREGKRRVKSDDGESRRRGGKDEGDRSRGGDGERHRGKDGDGERHRGKDGDEDKGRSRRRKDHKKGHGHRRRSSPDEKPSDSESPDTDEGGSSTSPERSHSEDKYDWSRSRTSKKETKRSAKKDHPKVSRKKRRRKRDSDSSSSGDTTSDDEGVTDTRDVVAVKGRSDSAAASGRGQPETSEPPGKAAAAVKSHKPLPRRIQLRSNQSKEARDVVSDANKTAAVRAQAKASSHDTPSVTSVRAVMSHKTGSVASRKSRDSATPKFKGSTAGAPTPEADVNVESHMTRKSVSKIQVARSEESREKRCEENVLPEENVTKRARKRKVEAGEGQGNSTKKFPNDSKQETSREKEESAQSAEKAKTPHPGGKVKKSKRQTSQSAEKVKIPERRTSQSPEKEKKAERRTSQSQEKEKKAERHTSQSAEKVKIPERRTSQSAEKVKIPERRTSHSPEKEKKAERRTSQSPEKEKKAERHTSQSAEKVKIPERRTSQSAEKVKKPERRTSQSAENVKIPRRQTSQSPEKVKPQQQASPAAEKVKTPQRRTSQSDEKVNPPEQQTLQLAEKSKTAEGQTAQSSGKPKTPQPQPSQPQEKSEPSQSQEKSKTTQPQTPQPLEKSKTPQTQASQEKSKTPQSQTPQPQEKSKTPQPQTPQPLEKSKTPQTQASQEKSKTPQSQTPQSLEKSKTPRAQSPQPQEKSKTPKPQMPQPREESTPQSQTSQRWEESKISPSQTPQPLEKSKSHKRQASPSAEKSKKSKLHLSQSPENSQDQDSQPESESSAKEQAPRSEEVPGSQQSLAMDVPAVESQVPRPPASQREPAMDVPAAESQVPRPPGSQREPAMDVPAAESQVPRPPGSQREPAMDVPAAESQVSRPPDSQLEKVNKPKAAVESRSEGAGASERSRGKSEPSAGAATVQGTAAPSPSAVGDAPETVGTAKGLTLADIKNSKGGNIKSQEGSPTGSVRGARSMSICSDKSDMLPGMSPQSHVSFATSDESDNDDDDDDDDIGEQVGRKAEPVVVSSQSQGRTVIAPIAVMAALRGEAPPLEPSINAGVHFNTADIPGGYSQMMAQAYPGVSLSYDMTQYQQATPAYSADGQYCYGYQAYGTDQQAPYVYPADNRYYNVQYRPSTYVTQNSDGSQQQSGVQSYQQGYQWPTSSADTQTLFATSQYSSSTLPGYQSHDKGGYPDGQTYASSQYQQKTHVGGDTQQAVTDFPPTSFPNEAAQVSEASTAHAHDSSSTVDQSDEATRGTSGALPSTDNKKPRRDATAVRKVKKRSESGRKTERNPILGHNTQAGESETVTPTSHKLEERGGTYDAGRDTEAGDTEISSIKAQLCKLDDDIGALLGTDDKQEKEAPAPNVDEDLFYRPRAKMSKAAAPAAAHEKADPASNVKKFASLVQNFNSMKASAWQGDASLRAQFAKLMYETAEVLGELKKDIKSRRKVTKPAQAKNEAKAAPGMGQEEHGNVTSRDPRLRAKAAAQSKPWAGDAGDQAARAHAWAYPGVSGLPGQYGDGAGTQVADALVTSRGAGAKPPVPHQGMKGKIKASHSSVVTGRASRQASQTSGSSGTSTKHSRSSSTPAESPSSAHARFGAGS